MKNLRIAIGADHAGFPAKSALVKSLKTQGYHVIDVGTNSDESTDYPDYAYSVAKAVAQKKADRGLLLCGTGIGMCIAANKVKGIRAATVWSIATAKLTSEHNWSNVLCLPARFLSLSSIKKIIHAWISTPHDMGGRHQRRIQKISKIESKR